MSRWRATNYTAILQLTESLSAAVVGLLTITALVKYGCRSANRSKTESNAIVFLVPFYLASFAVWLTWTVCVYPEPFRGFLGPYFGIAAPTIFALDKLVKRPAVGAWLLPTVFAILNAYFIFSVVPRLHE